MTNEDLAADIITEIDRVWGESPGFEETPEQFAWLEANYGIDRNDESEWRKALESIIDGPPEDVGQFLQGFLQKYRSSVAVYRDVK